MKAREIIQILESWYPAKMAESWDNVGLLTGRGNREIKKIYVALDVTDDVLEEAIKLKADMILTHHPLIFSPLRHIQSEDFIGERVLTLIENRIVYYAMHTNYDVCRMGELSGEYLDLQNQRALEESKEQIDLKERGYPQGIGCIGTFQETKSLSQTAQLVKERFSLDAVRVYGDLDKEIKKVAICPGSGKDYIDVALEQAADVYITGDIGHHQGIDAVARELAIIDAGHYGLEHIFIQDVKERLEQVIKEVEIISAPIRHPFMTL